MKTTNPPHFVLQQVLAASIQQTQICSGAKIQVIDDFVASVSLIGQAQELQNILCLLIQNASTAAPKIIVSTRQLLQTDKNMLLEFSVTDEASDTKKNPYYAASNVLFQAEEKIAVLGGKSERINISGAGVGLKFILKYEWFQPEAQKEIKELWPQRLTGKRILVVEDNEMNQKTISNLLVKQGITVDVAADGKIAIDLIEKNSNYDLVIMDLQMPHMDGFEATQYIRKKLHSDVPIIAITACTYPEEQVQCFKTGMNQYLTKPFAPEALNGLLYYFLSDNHPLLQNNFEVIRNAG